MILFGFVFFCSCFRKIPATKMVLIQIDRMHISHGVLIGKFILLIVYGNIQKILTQQRDLSRAVTLKGNIRKNRQ